MRCARLITVLVLSQALLAGDQAARRALTVPDPDTTAMQPRVARLVTKCRVDVLVNPGSADAWGHFGSECDAHRLDDDAAACSRRAGELAPQDFRWIYLLAIVRQGDGATGRELVELFEAASRRRADYPPVFYRLGEVLLTSGKPREAAAAFAKAIELDPKLAVAHRGLGQVMLSLNEPQRAVEHLERARALGREDRAVWAALAQAYMQSGDRQRAASAAARAGVATTLRNVPDPVRAQVEALGVSPQHCANRAAAMLSRGNYTGAIENLKIVEESRPDSPSVHQNLGLAYSQLGRFEDAIPHLRRVLEREPENVDAAEMLATALERLTR